jgi:hypothetical protein
MKKILLLSAIHLFIMMHVDAQCPDFEVELTSQAAVDNFKFDYPNCYEVPVAVHIRGDDITSLEGLSGIRSFASLSIVETPDLHSLAGLDSLRFVNHLIISNTGLVDLEGLEGLDSVVFDVVISNNLHIANLNGLENLRHLMWLYIFNNANLSTLEGLRSISKLESISVYDNPELLDLEGIPQLTAVNSIYIKGNDALQFLTGFEKVTVMSGDIHVEDNRALISLYGLHMVESCQDVTIHGNPLLTSMSGLGSLETISGDLSIFGNEALINMNGFFALEHVQGNFRIDENDALFDLHGLYSLHTVTGMLSGLFGVTSIGNLTITFNDNLSTCSVESICNYLQDGGIATIGGNIQGCDSRGQILEGCTVATEDNIAGESHVYPNPVSDALYVEYAGGSISSFIVFNAQGVVCPGVNAKEQMIDLSHLPAGMYYLRIQTDNGTDFIPVTKQ